MRKIGYVLSVDGAGVAILAIAQESQKPPGEGRRGDMVTLSEIMCRLDDIHAELVGEPSEEEYDEAIAKGYANPCGCCICLLRDEIAATMIFEDKLD